MLHRTFRFGEGGYPRLLGEVAGAPSSIYVRGALRNDLPLIAVVGTRGAGRYGLKAAEEFSMKLAKAGFGIVSGLALGIDAAAHEGALRAGGYTAAVLGNAIDDVYPPQNRGLAGRIVKSGGAIVSEYGPGEATGKNNFAERNRIVSGLSVAVVVIEAPVHSGALITARTGAEQGKDVFILPGSVNDPNFVGSHKLIRDGAVLVSSVEDILEDLRLT